MQGTIVFPESLCREPALALPPEAPQPWPRQPHPLAPLSGQLCPSSWGTMVSSLCPFKIEGCLHLSHQQRTSATIRLHSLHVVHFGITPHLSTCLFFGGSALMTICLSAQSSLILFRASLFTCLAGVFNGSLILPTRTPCDYLVVPSQLWNLASLRCQWANIEGIKIFNEKRKNCMSDEESNKISGNFKVHT